MIEETAFVQATTVAQRFLFDCATRDAARWAQLSLQPLKPENASLFWWGGSIPLIEFPLIFSKTRAHSGYILVSTSQKLAPILECSFSGAPLSVQIERILSIHALRPHFYNSLSKSSSTRHIFISSSEIYSEFSTSHGDITYYSLPHLSKSDRNPLQERLKRMTARPERIFDPGTLEPHWFNMLTKPAADPLFHKDGVGFVNDEISPVKYAQICNSDTGCINTGNFPCDPNAISGCSVTAWVMQLSSMKKQPRSEKIWPNSTKWMVNWPTTSPSFPQGNLDPSVIQSVWRFHQLLGTTSHGETQLENIANGSRIFGDFGVEIEGPNVFPDAEFHVGMAQASSTGVIFSAVGPFQDSVDIAAHTTFAYGSGNPWQTSSWIYICLGWGWGCDDKWIDSSQYSQRRILATILR